MERRVLTVPNAVSFVRLLAIPVFWWVLLGQERVGLAAALIFAIGATDWVDGYLARRLDQVTELGKVLDPLADRLMIASALVGGLVAGIIPAVIGWPLILREVLVSVGALILARRGHRKVEVKDLGKTATFILYGAIPSFYLVSADIAPWLFTPPAWLGGVVGIILYWWVGFQYARDLLTGGPSVESSTNQEV